MPGNPFYRSREWLAVRAAVLRRDRFICAAPRCGARATHVDHVVAMTAGGAPLDPSNLTSLCVACHSRKTARADGGFGHRRGRRSWGCDEAGLPLDADHAWHPGGGRKSGV